MKAPVLIAILLVGAVAQVDMYPWRRLNATVDGRLRVSTPIALPCFTSYEGLPNVVDDARCSIVREGWRTGDLRTNFPGSFVNLQSETCLSEAPDQCLLDNTVTPAGVPGFNATCNQGDIPAYYVEITKGSDVTAALDFARKYGVTLSVKNAGHDFMIRSSGKNTLNLWTHNLKAMEYRGSFVPRGCQKNVGRVVTTGAGVTSNEAHVFADKHDSVIQGPYSPTVPLSGGWLLGGGHNVLGPVYGMGVDRVVEFQIVTPDGRERMVNECQDPDLFFALRGGGGSAFGVVLSATHRVLPRKPIAFADVQLPSNISSDTALEWIELLVDESLELGRQGWGGHVAGTFATHFNPLPDYISDHGTKARASFKRITDYALSHGGTSNVAVYPNWLYIWNTFLLPRDKMQAGEIGVGSSRLLPDELFATKEGKQKIMSYLRSAAELGFDPVSFYTPMDTAFVYQRLQDPRGFATKKFGTSLTPAWYRSLWHLQTISPMAWNSSYEDRVQYITKLTNMTIQLEAIAGPNAGTHFNEANPFMTGWQESYYGRENYEKLLKIKAKYDPDNILACWKCIGFQDDRDIDLPRYKCQRKIQQEIYKNLGLKPSS
ncbi:FAD-binding domain-containing protein [Xylaria nigripes]|nr:FAD-binding domain-containing protein [Xylaria nigripes]